MRRFAAATVLAAGVLVPVAVGRVAAGAARFGGDGVPDTHTDRADSRVGAGNGRSPA